MNVIVVGSVNMDLVFTGLSALPLPGETISGRDFVVMPGGKGANQASAAATLGATVQFVAAVGTDAFGTQAADDLATRGVALDHLKRVDAATGVAAVLIDDSGENSIIIAPGANAHVAAADARAIAQMMDGAAVVLACLEVPLETVLEWSRIASERGWTFILNPAPAQALPAELLANTTILTPNETELAVLGTVDGLHAAGVDTVIVTRGGDGASLYRQGEPEHLQPAYDVQTVDTTGAGDAFNGALATSIAAGESYEDALAFAAAVGALATTALGARAALPTRVQVDAFREG